MKQIKKLILVIQMLCCCYTVNGQMLMSDIDAGLYKARVKLMDEFFDRFNGREGRPDIDDTDSLYRKKNLLLLFDGALFKTNKEKTLEEVQELIDSIASSNVQLNYSDSSWFARVVCQGKYKTKEVDFTLYLKVERRREDMFKWVIVKAEGDLFKLRPSKSSERIMLMPDDHETNFMSLHRITNEKDDYITNYAYRGFEVDETTVFFSFVYSGLLDIDNVTGLEFIFLQVPGYVLTVKDVARDTFNAGWLIVSYDKVSDAEKQNIQKKLYSIRTCDK